MGGGSDAFGAVVLYYVLGYTGKYYGRGIITLQKTFNDLRTSEEKCLLSQPPPPPHTHSHTVVLMLAGSVQLMFYST